MRITQSWLLGALTRRPSTAAGEAASLSTLTPYRSAHVYIRMTKSRKLLKQLFFTPSYTSSPRPGLNQLLNDNLAKWLPTATAARTTSTPTTGTDDVMQSESSTGQKDDHHHHRLVDSDFFTSNLSNHRHHQQQSHPHPHHHHRHRRQERPHDHLDHSRRHHNK